MYDINLHKGERMGKSFYPDFIDHPDVKIPSTWKNWKPKWWPCTQPDEEGNIHKLKYSYNIHYIDVEKLKILNLFGDYISQFEWAYQTQKGDRFRQIGTLATEWVMSENGLDFCKKWLNDHSRVFCIASAISLQKSKITPDRASSLYFGALGGGSLGYLYSKNILSLKEIKLIAGRHQLHRGVG